jgi:hypothetical protein
MTQQAVTDATPAQATLAAGEPAGRDRTLDEAAVADELLVEGWRIGRTAKAASM